LSGFITRQRRYDLTPRQDPGESFPSGKLTGWHSDARIVLIQSSLRASLGVAIDGAKTSLGI
jgi:hypothetical protein